MKRSLSSQTLRMAVLALDKMGFDSKALLAEAGIPHAKLLDPVARISVQQERRFWDVCARRTGEPLLALRMAQNVPFGAFPLLEYIGSSCRSVYQALTFFVRFSGIVHENWHPTLKEGGRHITLDLGNVDAPELSRYTNEFGLAVMVARLKYFSGRELPLSRVFFRHRLSGSLQAYREAFGAQVAFDQTGDGLLLAKKVKSIPCRNHDNFLLGALLKVAEKFSNRLPGATLRKESALLARVKAAVESLLPHGEPSIESIAAEMAMSVRSLQRKLESEGTSLTEQVTSIKKETAAGLIKRADLSNEDIALALGYSTLSAFDRAFKGWFQMTPSHYRKALH